jgi:uncharacterized SAM-binding protein YcdF (DUF218 family)
LIEWTPLWRRWRVPGGIFIALAAVAVSVFFGIGKWLVVQDPLSRADVIVVLSGRLPERAVEAAQIYHSGYAAEVWVSAPLSPQEELKAMKIFFVGEDFYNEKVLMAKGVPPDAIQILGPPTANTEEEVRKISGNLRSRNFHTAIVVTSKAHTRRVRTIWHKLLGSDQKVIVRFADGDPYDGAHWWRRTHDGLDVVRESLGLLNAWAGFPLRPSLE